MEGQRKRRSKEERIAEIDVKIEAHKKNIAKLEAKKKEILNPRPRKTPLTVENVIKQARKKGYSAKDIAEKLDLEVDD